MLGGRLDWDADSSIGIRMVGGEHVYIILIRNNESVFRNLDKQQHLLGAAFFFYFLFKLLNPPCCVCWSPSIP